MWDNNFIFISIIIGVLLLVFIFRDKFKFLSNPVKEKKKESKILDGSLGFMMKDPDYHWMQDPYNKRLYYIVDTNNHVVFPEMFHLCKHTGDEEPRLDSGVKNMVNLLSPVSYSLIEWNRYVVYRKQRDNTNKKDFYHFIKQIRKANDFRLRR